MWGTALDHVLSVQVVTADGQIQKASETENSDLFWALRGAGASFGVITQFTVRTEPEPGEIIEYTYGFSFGEQSEMAAIYAGWQKLVNDPALDRRYATLFIAQPLGALITGTFYGTKEEYDATGIHEKLPHGGLVDLQVMDWLGSLAHIGEKTGLALSETPSQFYGKSLAFREQDALSNDSITALFDYMGSADPATLIWAVIFDSQGGAINDVPANATAYPHRDKLWMYSSYVIGLPLSETTKKFTEGIHAIIQKGAPDAKTCYAGYVDPELSRIEAQQAYWGDHLPKLRVIKAKYDPGDLFHNPQSVDGAK